MLHVRSMVAALVVATALLSTGGRPMRASPASSAALLVAQGKQNEAQGNELAALKRYSDAVAIDPSSEAGWLALGALRAKRNELLEAEEVYTAGTIRVPLSIDLVVGRARVRRLRGRLFDAEDDLRRAWIANGNDGSPREVGILRERIALARDLKSQAQELASWRRLLAIARSAGDAALEKEASVQARALGLFVGEVDPVLGGRGSIDPVRKSMASVARRGG